MPKMIYTVNHSVMPLDPEFSAMADQLGYAYEHGVQRFNDAGEHTVMGWHDRRNVPDFHLPTYWLAL